MSSPLKVKWLSREVHPRGPYLALCTSEDEYRDALRKIKPPESRPWINPGADATTHTFSTDRGSLCLVCIGGLEDRTPVQVAALLVHEAVHVWQHHCDDIGETSPGREQEAYGIQCIAQTLMEEYAEKLAHRSAQQRRT